MVTHGREKVNEKIGKMDKRGFSNATGYGIINRRGEKPQMNQIERESDYGTCPEKRYCH